MVAVGEKILLLHFPKTGGTHLGGFLEKAGIVTQLDGNAHRIPSGYRQTPVVVLRNPAEWLYSYWLFRWRGGRACVPEADPHIERGWQETAAGLPERALDALYARYANTLEGTICAKYENLGASLPGILATLGEKSVKLPWQPVVRDVEQRDLQGRNRLAYRIWEEAL